MKQFFSTIFFILFVTISCSQKKENSQINQKEKIQVKDTIDTVAIIRKPIKIEIVKDLLYDKHTLADNYPYKDTTRTFQWNKIEKYLYLVDSLQQEKHSWAILQNYKNGKGEAPLVKKYKRDTYKRISDTLGVERYQSIPLFLVGDSVAERYGRDGFLVEIISNDTVNNITQIKTTAYEGKWKVPSKYIKFINDSVVFKKVICVDLTNQNVATLEKIDDKWLIRSMNPVTTGVHRPPHAQETPVGLFVIQEKKTKMFYLVDGTQKIAGYAPYASRFTNGAYFHGVPLKGDNANLIEFSSTLGTTPRSHMCVRNATSHAKFIFDWAITGQTLVFVFN